MRRKAPSPGRETADHLDEALVDRLQTARAYPSVSVLLTTVPGAALASHDVVRLDRLIDVARRRLAGELAVNQVDAIADRLRSLALRARRQPARRALALYASDHQTALVQLPMAVADRVVVDPTFATRDLARVLSLRPRCRVLVVSERAARVIEGWPGQLREISEVVLPAGTDPMTDHRGRRFARDRNGERRAMSTAHFREVAEALEGRHAVDPLPLVLAGVSRHHAFWRSRPSLSAALIGTIRGNHDRTPLGRLDRLAAPIVDEHVRARRRAALDRLAAEPPSRCAGGIGDVWAAAATKRVSLLCVEESYVFPARPVRSGRGLVSAKDVEHPEVLDDAVDELIEMVALAGGEIVVVRDGALEGCGHVAAVLRSS